MTVVVTRNVPPRYRGFLASCMLEIGPGVYISPKLNHSVRNRIWGVLIDWWIEHEDRGVLMIWKDNTLPSGIGIEVLGSSKIELMDHEGLFLARKDLSDSMIDLLKKDRLM